MFNVPQKEFFISGSGRKEHIMKRWSWVIVALLFLFSAKLSFAAPNMEDGLWEITTMVDMPGMSSKSFTNTSCLTKEKAVPQTTESGCTIKDVKSLGNTVTWTVVCKEGTSTGKITYAGTTMEGFIETTVKTNGGTMTMKSTMKGKRIGPCK
jgi:hypothetical protein